MKIVAGGGNKERNFGPPTLRPSTLRGSTLLCSTLRGSTFWAPPFGAPLFLGLGPPPFGPPPFGAPPLRGPTLRGSTLRGSTLRGSTLRGPTLRGPTLRGPNSRFGASTLLGPPPFWAPHCVVPKFNIQKLAEVEIGRSRNWPKSIALDGHTPPDHEVERDQHHAGLCG